MDQPAICATCGVDWLLSQLKQTVGKRNKGGKERRKASSLNQGKFLALHGHEKFGQKGNKKTRTFEGDSLFS